jgi:hypothetical protein
MEVFHAQLETQLSHEAFEAARKQGEMLTLEDAADRALDRLTVELESSDPFVRSS